MKKKEFQLYQNTNHLDPLVDAYLESAVLYWFLDLIEEDTRIGTAHISIYTSISTPIVSNNRNRKHRVIIRKMVLLR